MSNALVGWKNLVGTSVLAASSAATNMPVQNLQDDTGTPAVAWQTVSGVVSGAYFTVTPATGGQTWRAFGLFRTNLTPSASVTFALYNSPSTLVWSTTVGGPVPGYGQVVAIVPVDTAADYAKITITDNSNPDGFLNVPLAFAGPVWCPASGLAWSTTAGRDDNRLETTTRGGQEYPVLLWQRRRWEIALDGVRSAELWGDIGEIDRLSRAGGNMLFVPDLTSATLAYEATFGRVLATADVTFPYQGADRRAWRARATERI